ncbi:RnfH family protein [Methylibium sp.]|uniref:RnfH family protein n=1 Tax=Methylibium sp. TaxID=2067992 RepID=UPI0017F9C831|nr:RnfH family protein [Methylibium sp.]MBA3589392.1 RnfH family protein [Methylibium sp.]
MRVEVAYSPCEREVDHIELELPQCSTVADALQASGLLQRHPGIDLALQRMGVWGRACRPDDVLREGDRLELYRALEVDPKEARRLRQQRQRSVANKR